MLNKTPKIFLVIVICLNIIAAYYAVINYDNLFFKAPGTEETLRYSKIVKAGDDLLITRNIDEPDDCDATAYRYLSPLDDLSKNYLISVVNIKTQDGIRNFQIHIPENITPGKYIYHARINYYCNFLQRVGKPYIYDSVPIAFEVTN